MLTHVVFFYRLSNELLNARLTEAARQVHEDSSDDIEWITIDDDDDDDDDDEELIYASDITDSSLCQALQEMDQETSGKFQNIA